MGIFDLFSGGRKPGLPDKIEVAPGIRLSTELAEYWPRIERTRMQSIGIKATPIDNPAPRKSSIGCYPILPRGFAYPQNAHGTPLYPLAQICCSELPLLGDYPDKGYLQLYIWLGDYGADFGNPTNQRNFRVLYFEDEEIGEQETNFFIALDDLKKRDFSRVFYTWDCC